MTLKQYSLIKRETPTPVLAPTQTRRFTDTLTEFSLKKPMTQLNLIESTLYYENFCVKFGDLNTT